MALRRLAVLALTAVVALTLGGCAAAGSGAVTAASLRTPFPTGVQDAVPDHGPEARKAAVRRATVALKTDEIRAFAIDPDLRRRSPSAALAAVTDDASVARRTALLGRARTAALTRDLRHAFLFYVRQDFGPDLDLGPDGSRAAFLDQDVWATGAFHVDRWQGVQVAGGTARVLVRGEGRGTAWDGTPKRQAPVQYKLILRADATAPHGWRLVHDQGTPTSP